MKGFKSVQCQQKKCPNLQRIYFFDGPKDIVGDRLKDLRTQSGTGEWTMGH